jgi:hypothetical protein
VTLHDTEHDRYQWVDVDTALALVKPDRVRETIGFVANLLQ